jgi:Dihaem cytochrome c
MRLRISSDADWRSRRLHLSSRRHQLRLGVSAAFALLVFSGCAPKPLPEDGTATEQLYVHRCGVCHRAYAPSTLTPAMWQLQVDAMELKISAAGMPPLTPGDKQTILGYLERHSAPPPQ